MIESACLQLSFFVALLLLWSCKQIALSSTHYQPMGGDGWRFARVEPTTTTSTSTATRSRTKNMLNIRIITIEESESAVDRDLWGLLRGLDWMEEPKTIDLGNYSIPFMKLSLRFFGPSAHLEIGSPAGRRQTRGEWIVFLPIKSTCKLSTSSSSLSPRESSGSCYNTSRHLRRSGQSEIFFFQPAAPYGGLEAAIDVVGRQV